MSLPFFRGWVVVGAALVVLMASFGLQFSYGVFLPHIVADLGIDFATASAPFSAYLACYAVLSYVSGWLTDRLGPRIIVLAGGVFMGAGYALIGAVSAAWQLYLALTLVAGIGMSAAFVPLNTTVVRWFVRRRGLALAIAGSGNAGAAFFGPSAAALLIGLLDWRGAIVGLAIGAGALIAGAGLLLVRDPESVGLRPDGDPAPPQGMAETVPSEVSWTLPEACGAVHFWFMLGAFALTWIVLFVPFVHLPSMLADYGHDASTAAGVVAAMGLGGLAGRLAIGWLSDFIGRVPGIHLALAAQMVACLLVAQSQSIAVIAVAMALFSAGASSVAILFVAVVGDAFGRRHVGAIAGFVFATAGAVSAFGPYGAGLVRDITGGYQLAFQIGAGLNLAAILLLALFRAPVKRPATV